MPFGGPTSWALTVRWDGTTWVDESDYVRADSEVVITRGTGSDADQGDPQPGVLSASLDNARVTVTGGVADASQVGRFTADNPLSPLYPNVEEGAWTRFAVTRGASTSFRHRGRAALSAPDVPGGQMSRASVGILSVDMLGTIDRKRLAPDWVEQMRQAAETVVVDLYPMAESTAYPTTLENVGSGTGTGSVVRALSNAGTATTERPEGIALDSSVVLTAANGVGPVIIADTSAPAGTVTGILFAFKTPDRTAPAGASKYLAVGLKADGSVLWSLRLVNNANQCDINLYDAAGTFVVTVYFAFSAIGQATGDDQWLTFFMRHPIATVVQRTANGQALFASGVGVDIRQTDAVVLGGLIGGKRTAGKQTACVSARYAGLVIAQTTNLSNDYLVENFPTTASARFSDLNLYCDFGSTTFGTRDREVVRTGTSGRTGLDVLAELTRTVGAVAVASRTSDGSLGFRLPDLQQPETVSVTVDLDADADGAGGLPFRRGDTPSRQTVTYPAGSVTYVDPTRERADGSTIETCAASAVGALDVAARRVNSARRLRLSSIRVDLATASNDLWAAVMGLEIGDRIRVNVGTSGTPLVRLIGYTYVDYHVTGWEEHYGRDRAWWELFLVPADDPVRGRWGGSGVRRKWAAAPGAMTVTGGTCVGTTGTGTVIVTTASGPTFTTVGARYPMALRWNGEDITVSAPGGATSPQTFTVTARGVNGTVARVHAAGEPVNVALPAAWTY